MKKLKIVFLLSLLVVFVIACASDGTRNILKKETDDDVVHDTFTIKAAGSHEECIELKPGQVFDYKYDASQFVNFNIHYHAEDKVYHPVKRKGYMMGEGMVDPSKHDYFTPKQEFYCLMWNNINEEPVEVSFKCVLRDK
jgi:hypothetical protein